MGDSSWGAIEVNIDPESGVDPWTYAVSVFPFVSSGRFGWDCLFGRDDELGFDPVAPENRGLPSDLSEEVQHMHPPADSWGENYLTLSELSEVNWQEVSRDGSEVWAHYPNSEKGCPFSEFDQLSPEDQKFVKAGESITWTDYQGREVEIKEERLTREFVCRQSGWWWLIRDAMAQLRERIYPSEGIRIIVWRW